MLLQNDAFYQIQQDYYNLGVDWDDLPSDVRQSYENYGTTGYLSSHGDAASQAGTIRDPAVIGASIFAGWRLGYLAVKALGLACADGDCTNEASALQRAVDSGFKAVQGGIGRGYNSFNAFKAAEGTAGPGQAWHHIVGQQPANIAQFGAQAIHNTNNLIRLPTGAGTIHQQITNYYNSIQPLVTGSTTLRVREWLATQSFEAQWQFGIDLIEQFGGGQYIIQQLGGNQ